MERNRARCGHYLKFRTARKIRDFLGRNPAGFDLPSYESTGGGWIGSIAGPSAMKGTTVSLQPTLVESILLNLYSDPGIS